MTVQESIQILLNEYDISLEAVNNIAVSPRIVSTLAYIAHQYDEIVVASLFGSRVDKNKIVTDSSDIDFLIKLKASEENNWPKICHYIIEDLNKILDDETVDNIDISIFNGEHKCPNFKSKAYEQSFMIKGRKKDLNY